MPRFRRLLILLCVVSTLSFGSLAQEDPYSFGPIILGKALAPLPECQRPKDHPYDVEANGPCQETIIAGVRTIRNVPYDGAEAYLTATDECFKQHRGSLVETDAECAVAQMAISITEEQCGPVLKALQNKFGSPASHKETMQNGFGVSWDVTTYLWSTKNGDTISYSVHLRREGGCFLVAETQKFQAEYEERVHKKVQF
ncbi:MAG: hypothetical protein WCA49_14620 [Candidatus Sulfotelmatobacter sp.]